MIDQYNQASFGQINSSSKLETLSKLKNIPGRESYLKDVEISKHRVALSRLRLCSHSLQIERGRYDQSKDPENSGRQNRLCQYCKAHGREVVENEAHFLVSCPLYNELREKLLSHSILHTYLSEVDKATHILSDTKQIKCVAKFIYLAFEEREIHLDALSSINDMIDCVEKHIASASDPQKNQYAIKNSYEDGLKLTLVRIPSHKIISTSENGLRIILSKTVS
jgi:hypothetical protein